MSKLNINILNQLIIKWADERNLIEGSTSQAQFVKLIEEAGELANSIAKKKDVKDDLGDMFVVMSIIAEQQGVSMQEAIEIAWDDIKDRKGRMVDGVFIKESDL